MLLALVSMMDSITSVRFPSSNRNREKLPDIGCYDVRRSVFAFDDVG
jgi:hypothetical protein